MFVNLLTGLFAQFLSFTTVVGSFGGLKLKNKMDKIIC